jgi:hypothetical protein
VDVAISDQMMTFWSNFAKTGNPSGEGVPAWPAYSAATGYQVMHIGEKSHAAPDALRDRYLFLDAAAEKRARRHDPLRACHAIATARPLLLVAIMWRLTCAVDAQQPSIPSLTDTTWTLWKFEERGGSVLEPEDRTKYTLRFGAQLETATGLQQTAVDLEGDRGRAPIRQAGGSASEMRCRVDGGTNGPRLERNPLVQRQVEPPLSGSEERTWAGTCFNRSCRSLRGRPPASRAITNRVSSTQKGAEFGPWLRRFIAQVKVIGLYRRRDGSARASGRGI